MEGRNIRKIEAVLEGNEERKNSQEKERGKKTVCVCVCVCVGVCVLWRKDRQ